MLCMNEIRFDLPTMRFLLLIAPAFAENRARESNRTSKPNKIAKARSREQLNLRT